MRILFIHKWSESLAIESLSAILKKYGHETDLAYDPGVEGSFILDVGILKRLIDADQRILDQAQDFNPDLIAFSCVTNAFPWTKATAERLKRLKPETPIIVGGPHPTILPELTIADPHIDYVCIGEGDQAIVDLVHALEEKRDTTAIPNIWAKRDGSVFRNGVAPLLEHLDELPVPDKDIFHKWGVFTNRAYVISSRKCPYDCNYCQNHFDRRLYKGKGRYVRQHTVEYTIDMLKTYKERYGLKSFHFHDEIFVLSKKWLRSFIPRYKAEVGLPFYCLIRPNIVDDEIVELLKDGGCDTVRLGVESGNPYIRNQILNRNIPENETMIEAGRTIKRHGIRLEAVTMFGLPEETPEHAWETVELILAMKPDGFFTNIFVPFPGTELGRMVLEKGLITEEQARALERGEIGFMHQESILNQPHRNFMINIMLLAPFIAKMPWSKNIIHRICRTKHSRLLNVTRVLSILLMSPWEGPKRASETLNGLFTYLRYRFRLRSKLNRNKQSLN